MQTMIRRPGFTLVETLVALVLFQLGIVALVAVAGTSARDLAEAAMRRRGHAMARGRAEVLLASACAAPSTGSAVHANGLREWWSVSAEGQRRSVVDSIEVRLPRGRTAAVVARAWTLCPQ